MIITTQAYKDMMQGRAVESRIRVIIESAQETVVLGDNDIVRGSASLNWRASNNKDLTLGTCYASSLSFSSFQDVNSQIQGSNLKITPTLYYKVDTSGTEQEIPLGVFFCSEPTVFSRTTSYDCLDAMTFFDRVVTSRTVGTPFNLLTFICNECGVQLGNSNLQIAAMANGNQTLVLDPNRVNTYRDALSYISMILGGYCIIGRDGKLYVRQFHVNPDMSLIRRRRLSTSFGGYKTMFTGVTCRFLAEQNYYPYFAGNDDSGLVLDLGDIPIIEDTERVKNAILTSIWSIIQQIEYYPCSIDMVGDPSIEAGDMIETPDREGYMRNVLLTSVTFGWHGKSNITSEGSNPKLRSVSTVQKKQLKNTEVKAKENTVVTTTYVNAGQITVGSAETEEITSLRFVTNKSLTAIFGAEIPVFSSGEGYVTIGYYDGGIQGDTVKAHVHEGYNLITLVNHLPYDANRVVLLQLKAQTEGIGSGTAPTLTIDADTIRSYVFAQGIETEAPWDGIISISETIEYVEARMSMYGLTDGVTVSIHEPVEQGLSDVVASMVSELNVYGLSDTVSVSLEYGDQILRMGEGHRAGMGRMYARF